MQRSLALAFLFLVACSGSNSTGDLYAGDGGTLQKGGLGGLLSPGPVAAASDAGTDAAPASTTPATSTNPPATAQVCTLTNLELDPNNACQGCGLTNCCAEIQACDGSSDCRQLLDCANHCGSDRDCTIECVQTHSQSSYNMVVNANTCQKQKCAAQCE